mgnify:FL=1
MQLAKRLLVSVFVVLALAGTVVALNQSPTYAAGAGGGGGGGGSSCGGRFLTFPAWYSGLVDPSTCDLLQPGKGSAPAIQGYIMRIVLNVIEILLQVVAYVTAGYIIYGGFKYLTSPSDSNKVAAARKTIQNALIGLIISFLSIAIVTLIAGNIK